MANAEHVELLRQGVEVWNRWRGNNPEIMPDLRGIRLCGSNLSEVDLSEADLEKVNLSGAKLQGADLSGVNLSEADVSGTGKPQVATLLMKFNLDIIELNIVDLSRADLSGFDLHGAHMHGVDLQDADLRGAKLSRASLGEAKLREADLRGAILRGLNLSGFDLNGFDLSEVDLSDANLNKTQVLRTCFERAKFTGACLEDWNVNSATSFEGVICDYIYLKAEQQERRPRKGTFNPGEFAALFQQALDTVDLIFKDGIDWRAFFQSFQDLRSQYADRDLAIQAIEKKRSGAFVVRLEVAEDTDKASIESSAKELYESRLALMEQRYRDVLQAKDGEIIAYREQSANLMEIIKLQAARPPMAEIPKYDLRGAQFAGGFSETVQGNQVGGTINNQASETLSLAEAAAEIQNLLKQLEASNPSPTEVQQIAYLDAMIHPTRRERFIGALKAGSSAAIDEISYGPVLKALVEGWQGPGG